jgi:hypothetical protein
MVEPSIATGMDGEFCPSDLALAQLANTGRQAFMAGSAGTLP